MIEVSYFSSGTAVNGAYNCAIDMLFECIRIGGKDGSLINKIQRIRQNPPDKKALKLSLPYIMWQGKFNYRSDAGLISLSGLMCIDIDHKTPEESTQLRTALIQEPWVVSIFQSPSGDGLKVVVLTDNHDRNLYKNFYKQIEKIFCDKYGIEPDDNCEALSQGCFASYDPDIYVNLAATPIPIAYDPAFDVTNGAVQHSTASTENYQAPVSAVTAFLNSIGNGMSDDDVLEILDRRFHRFPVNYTDGHRTKAIFIQASQLCKAGIVEKEALSYLQKNFLPTGYDEIKLEHEVASAYRKCKSQFGSERSNYRPYNVYKTNTRR